MDKKDMEVISDLIEKLGKQATDSLIGQVVLIELLEEKGILTKEEYKEKMENRNGEIRKKIAQYFEGDINN